VFFKKKKSTLDIGTALVKFINPEESLINGLNELTEDKRRKISDEIYCLYVITILIAVKETVSDIKTTASILDAFFKAIKESREFNANEVLDGGKNRYIAYEEAFYTPHHNNPLVIIGKQFSEFCDCEMDLDLITTGGIIFGATLASVSEFIQSYKIDCVK